MFIKATCLLLLTVLGLAMDLKELSERVETIHNSPLVVMSMVFDSDKTGDLSVHLEQAMKNRVGYL